MSREVEDPNGMEGRGRLVKAREHLKPPGCSGSDAEVDSLEFRSPSLLRSRLFQLWCRGSSALSEMAKRGYKLRILFWFWWKGFGWELDMCFANFEQILGKEEGIWLLDLGEEFVAHTTNVNCLNIGKKACRLLISGGDDHKVNLWAIGKPTSLMSLCGHTSPVESVTFDSAEVLVAAGVSTGVIKLWDLEEAKMVRTLTGHRSNCTAVEFHPFGEFFASGSLDTNLKVWDIRKKGCIHTYKGHTRGISTIRFTPDGRWVVSGGFDNVVKVWDLTAGKLLHDFKFHEGHIRSIDFHPLEFLLATGVYAIPISDIWGKVTLGILEQQYGASSKEF
ncbi:Katanin p80 WD40 repeat-containing subunit B1-like [Vitis vinifera]|uniref:Katanin p80 WD40 repeat-containing subunit B1-like n=1 Tax=Vitis vinifera TaxID=29760 RepID=A0A438EF70_VITVI|nr:Katanin p80 WD40 repeat-containing subunit B1-like [Vitis vinifera]